MTNHMKRIVEGIISAAGERGIKLNIPRLYTDYAMSRRSEQMIALQRATAMLDTLISLRRNNGTNPNSVSLVHFVQNVYETYASRGDLEGLNELHEATEINPSKTVYNLLVDHLLKEE